MTNGNDFKLGSSNTTGIDLNKLKSGAKRADFESESQLLQIFDAVDSNGNKTLDIDEVTVFTEKLRTSAGDDQVLSQKEAKQVFKEQQEKEKASNADSKKYDIKSKNLFGFVNKFLEVSEKSKIKSSVVDGNGNQTITYENGAQEILNKDGSRILSNIVDGRKVTKNIDKDGNVTSDEILNEETGDIETLTYDKQGTVKEHTAKNDNITTYLGVKEGFSQDKPIKQIINAGTSEQETIEYEYSGENSYTSTTTKADIKNITVVENGETQASTATQYKNGKKVQTMSLTKDGTQTHTMYDENEKVRYESVTDKNGRTTEKTFNENGRGLQSVITDRNGKIQTAKYDGKGNTLIVVQNGESFQKICQEFDRTKAELAHTNKGTVHYQNGEPYFLAGETARVSGEFAPDHKGVRGRKTSEQVKDQYARDEQQRVINRLQGKESKEVTVSKNYKDWTHYAKDMLASEGIKEATNKQVTDRTNELRMMNPSIQVPKKGNKITALKTQAEIKAEKEAEAKKQAEAQQAQQASKASQTQQIHNTQQRKPDARIQREAEHIADNLYTELRKKEFATVDKNENFKAELNKINSNNVIEVYRAYEKKSPKESLASSISWELTSSNKAIRTAEGKIFNALYTRASKAGIDKQHIENFRKEADLAMSNNNAKSLDKVMGNLVQTVDNKENLSVDARAIQSRGTTENRNQAVKTVKGIYSEAQQSLKNHNDSQGWAGSIVKGMREAFSSPESPSKIQQHMTTYNKQIQRLEASAKGTSTNPLDNIDGGKNEKAFKDTFKSIYGVNYDPVAIEAYNNKKDQYKDSSAKYAVEQKFNSDMSKLISSNGKLSEETRTQANPTAGTTTVVTATKEQVYNRELNKFASFIGMGNSKTGLAQINTEMKKAGIDPNKATLDTKYKFLSDRAKACSKLLHNQTVSATGGKSFNEIQKEYKKSYAGAFGTQNDIQRKVEEYTTSIDTSTAILKSGIKIVGGVCIGVATGGTGIAPLLTAAGSQSALSFAVDASDLATSKTGGTKEQYMKLAGQATVDGISQIVSGGVSNYIGGTSLSATSKVLLNTAADTGIDMSVEYINTGEVTLQNTLISAFSSGVGHTLSEVFKNNPKKEAELEEAFELSTETLEDQNIGWLGETTDDHNRYMTELSADEAGNRPARRTYVGNGIEAQSGEARGIRYDVRMSQHNESIADIENLLGKGASKTDFGDGLVKLEDRFRANGSRTIDQRQFKFDKRGRDVLHSAAAIIDEAGGTVEQAKDVTLRGSFSKNKKVASMGLNNRLDIVQDAGTFSAKAYSDKPADMNGWTQQSQVSADNGFHAKALEKDNVVMVVFRGSDDLGDLKVDHQMISGKLPDQFQNAIDFMEQVRTQNPDKKIVVTGHSLGGGLTELVASKYDDVLGISFDAVGTKGLVESTDGIAKGLKDNKNTINYIVSGDVISNATPHVGQTTLVEVVADVNRGNKLQSPHAIGNFSGSAGNNSLAGVEDGFVQRSINASTSARAKASAKGLTLDSAIAQSATGTIEFDDKSFKKIQSQFSADVSDFRANFDELQKQIDVVTNPTQKASLQKILDTRKNEILVKTDIKSRSTVIKEITGDEINKILYNDYGFEKPAFLGGNSKAALIEIDKPTKFVRVNNDKKSFAKGSWLMAYDDVKGLTPEQIKEKFALPDLPKYIVEVEVPAGAQLYTGECNSIKNWGNGGGTQYFLAGGNRPKIYGNIKPITPEQ